jgi:hypothetical protein
MAAMPRISAFVLLFLTLVAPCAAQSGISAWFVDSLVKVFPDTPATANRVMTVSTARNAHASLQIALRSASQQSVTIRVRAPQWKKSALETHLFQVGYVRVSSHPKDVPLDEVVRPEVGLYPDPLYPLNGPFRLDGEQTESFWISLFTPADARPGIYRGEVQIQTGKLETRLPFQVEVFAATVPKQQKLWVTNWLWLDRDVLARHYPRLNRQPDLYWTLVENIAKTMADYRQNTVFTPVRTLAKAQLVDGAIRYDFTDFDRWVDIFDRAGMRMIEGGHISERAGGGFDAPYVLPTDLIENGTVVRQGLPNKDPRAEKNLREFLQQLRAHLTEKGWINRYVQHIHDEPHGPEMPIYKRFAMIVREEMPEVPTIDAIDLKEDIPSVEPTTIWVPILSSFDDKFDLIRQHEVRGGQGWYYICLFPRGRYLNRFIDYPLLKTRLLPWLDFRYGLTGYLHWGGNWWTDDPINDLQPNWGGDTFLPAGDDAIVYPDRMNDGVFVSTRLEVLRQGIEDYELLKHTQSRLPERADTLGKTVMPDFTTYVRDVNRFRGFERELLRMAAEADRQK